MIEIGVLLLYLHWNQSSNFSIRSAKPETRWKKGRGNISSQNILDQAPIFFFEVIESEPQVRSIYLEKNWVSRKAENTTTSYFITLQYHNSQV